MIEIIKGFLIGAATGAGLAILGYAKAYKGEKKEDLQWEKMVYSVIVAAIVGGVSEAFHLSPESIELKMAEYGIVSYVLESATKAIVRFAKSKGWI